MRMEHVGLPWEWEKSRDYRGTGHSTCGTSQGSGNA